MDEKSSDKFVCKKCDYSTCRLSHWQRHIATPKHIEDKKKGQYILEQFVCVCGNKYNFQSGLSKHKTKCTMITKSSKSTYEKLFENILKDNKELTQIIFQQNAKLIEQNNKLIELSLNNTSNTTSVTNETNNNNTTNNNFNLQMFLNVECKNAININDFVDSIQLTLEDLENTGRLGYVEGISKIFLDSLKDINVNDRPIHCSDQKRETFYIKDNNIWEKENSEREKITLAIKKVASKNIKQIPLWQKANPDCFDSSSKKNDKYLKIVSNSMNGLTPEETQQNYDKIISKIAKEVTIKKIK